MRTCRKCGRAESLLPGAAVDLCKSCDAEIAQEAHQRAQVIHRALRTLGEATDLSTRLAQCALILQQAEALHRYEAWGLHTIYPPPSELLQEFRARREALERTAEPGPEA
jgi:hypothetical protein